MRQKRRTISSSMQCVLKRELARAVLVTQQEPAGSEQDAKILYSDPPTSPILDTHHSATLLSRRGSLLASYLWMHVLSSFMVIQGVRHCLRCLERFPVIEKVQICSLPRQAAVLEAFGEFQIEFFAPLTAQRILLRDCRLVRHSPSAAAGLPPKSSLRKGLLALWPASLP